MRTISKWLPLWACLAGLLIRAEGGKKESVEEWHDRGMDGVTLIGSDYANPQVLRRYWEAHFLQRHRFPKLLVITAYATREDFDRISENAPLEMTEKVTQRLYEAARHRPPQYISEILAVGPNAVLRSVAGADISRSVLHGSDPTLFDMGPVHCEILQMNTHQSLVAPLDIEVFLKTNPLPTQQQAETIARKLRTQLGYPYINIYMRTDAWFIGFGSFPLWYPFSNDTNPPQLEPLGKISGMFCGVSKRGLDCHDTY